MYWCLSSTVKTKYLPLSNRCDIAMIYEEETYVELHDGCKGLNVLVRSDDRTKYDIELANGELTTVYHEEVTRPVKTPTK